MELKFKDDFYKFDSITNSFVIPEFKDFNIITGINGSGKTQFLRAIKAGEIIVTVDNQVLNHHDDIGFFDYESFKLKNEKSVEGILFKQEKQKIFDELHKEKIFQVLYENIWPVLLIEFEVEEKYFAYKELVKILINKKPEDFNLVKTQNLDSNQIREFNRLKEYVCRQSNLDDFNKSINQIKDNSRVLKEYFKDYEEIHNLSEEDIDNIINNYVPKNFIEIGFGEVFKKYNDNYDQYSKSDSIVEQDLRDSEKQKKFQTEQGEFPWLFINRIFKKYKEGSFDFTYEMERPKELWNEALKPKIINTTTKDYVDFEKLSSGEKVLLTLTLFLYQADKKELPKVLLLDEIDATLHPSMCKNLVQTLQENIITNGTKIIFTSHTPFTVKEFLSDDNKSSLVLRNKDNNDKEILDVKNPTNRILPFSITTYGEIMWKAYEMPTIEFHCELYGYLKESNKKFYEKQFENYLVNKGILKDKKWNPEIGGGAISEEDVTLQTFVRNKIHHPENKTMKNIKYSEEELKKSIEQMISILNT